MKRLTITLLALILVGYARAGSAKEIGLILNDFNNFGINYKTGNSNSLWRFNTFSLSGIDDALI